MRTSPWSAFAALCASIVWSGWAFFRFVPEAPDAWMWWCLAPAIVGGLILPWSTLRRQGVALIAGPLVVASTFLMVLVGIVLGGVIGALIWG
ncbi:hypothetical protein [Rhodococcus sp. IEGM 1408]|uniref:hypothetical protein n=1 Tax=Rhodococcus sp. IEGM 1408 TaxID=3082220 RepID=UPI002955D0A1|nr:hypothetical protein [Rhodococcus sp. IEGM 1408]MDV8002777.1 hypothetical protein [Rhodococcus sp. IEGM 1408]